MGITMATIISPMKLLSRSRPPIPPNMADIWANMASIDIAPATVATMAMINVSLLPTWAISWANTPANSFRFRILSMPVVTATVAWSGLRPVANALGESDSIRNTLGIGSPAKEACSLTMLYSSGSSSSVISVAWAIFSAMRSENQ